jgi:hypothetical protein
MRAIEEHAVRAIRIGCCLPARLDDGMLAAGDAGRNGRHTTSMLEFFLT